MTPPPPTPAPVRRLRWPARLWERVSIYLPVLLMGLLALGSYWLLRITPSVQAPRPERPVTHEPDYVMRRFSVKVFDAEGRLSHEIAGSEARHHPDSNTVEIDQARIRTLPADGPVSTATAQRIVSNHDQTVLTLEGDAMLVREAARLADGSRLPRLAFQGEHIRVNTETQRVQSDRPLLLLRGDDQLHASALDYDGQQGIAQLQGRVRAQLAAPAVAR
ncbi:MAG: export transporter periplasmic protein LptC [Pseudomonadota bacterium]